MKDYSEYRDAVDLAQSHAALVAVAEQAENDFAAGHLIMTDQQWVDITIRLGARVKGFELAQKLIEYPANTACIQYRDGSGKVKDWFLGANPKHDNETTLRDHLRRSLPAAEFIGWAIK